MMERSVPWWRRALEFALNGIRTGFGLFRRHPQAEDDPDAEPGEESVVAGADEQESETPEREENELKEPSPMNEVAAEATQPEESPAVAQPEPVAEAVSAAAEETPAAEPVETAEEDVAEADLPAEIAAMDSPAEEQPAEPVEAVEDEPAMEPAQAVEEVEAVEAETSAVDPEQIAVDMETVEAETTVVPEPSSDAGTVEESEAAEPEVAAYREPAQEAEEATPAEEPEVVAVENEPAQEIEEETALEAEPEVATETKSAPEPEPAVAAEPVAEEIAAAQEAPAEQATEEAEPVVENPVVEASEAEVQANEVVEPQAEEAAPGVMNSAAGEECEPAVEAAEVAVSAGEVELPVEADGNQTVAESLEVEEAVVEEPENAAEASVVAIADEVTPQVEILTEAPVPVADAEAENTAEEAPAADVMAENEAAVAEEAPAESVAEAAQESVETAAEEVAADAVAEGVAPAVESSIEATAPAVSETAEAVSAPDVEASAPIEAEDAPEAEPEPVPDADAEPAAVPEAGPQEIAPKLPFAVEPPPAAPTTADKVAAALKARGEDAEQSPFSVIIQQVYDGPLDLLLDLIRKQDIDIYDIPIAQITSQFLAYVNKLKASDMDVAGEFIYMAALLIHIKSKMLLPRAPASPEEDAEDPRRELVERLLEHERFKNAAQMLLEKQMIEAATWTNPGVREFREDSAAEPEIAADTTDLVRVFQEILERARRRPTIDLEEDSVTVGQMIQFLSRRLTMEDKPVALRRLLSHTRSERALIAMFLALLELVRMQAILLRQDRLFSDIFIKKTSGFENVMNAGTAAVQDDWR